MASKPVFHADDKEAAVARAKKIGGMVVKSVAPRGNPGSTNPDWGYWSDQNSMVRVWETLVYPKDD